MTKMFEPDPETMMLGDEDSTAPSLAQELERELSDAEREAGKPPKDFDRILAQPLRMGNDGKAIIETHDDVKRLANLVWNSEGIKIGGARSYSDVCMAIMHGMEAGLSWSMCVKNVMIVNGKPAIWGDCLLGLVYRSGEVKAFEETYDEETRTARCRVVRILPMINGEFAEVETIREFSAEDAETAQLWGKTGRSGQPTPWVTYPKRMLAQRARGFALRDGFADRLGGLGLAEDWVGHREAFDPSRMRAASGEGSGRGSLAQTLGAARQEGQSDG